MARSALCPMLVRREDQLAILEEALLAANRGEGRFVVVSGEAGVGKTRLVTELSLEAARLGCSVLWGGCSEAELSLPYLPFIEAIGNHLATEDSTALGDRLGPSRGPLGQLFPQLAGEPAEIPADAAQGKLRLFEAIVALLTEVGRRRTLVMVVEDVHWADDSTRELLDHLARRLVPVPVLVVVTFRSDELHRRHPFQPTLHAWKRSGVAEIVDLEPLSEAGITEMVAAILGNGEVDRELNELLFQRSEGNPFVLEEMLRETADELTGLGDLSRESLRSIEIPETVRDTILLRLGSWTRVTLRSSRWRPCWGAPSTIRCSRPSPRPRRPLSTPLSKRPPLSSCWRKRPASRGVIAGGMLSPRRRSTPRS